ncbi:RICIN domain-containing protein [Thermopolyspora sp. NPDC052614]|uniref:RICIN domain-containing protein n=1 Tax=Thermopolyspora sp. NPDC052614 TaxID=3155682 RepID=UPI00343EEDDF
MHPTGSRKQSGLPSEKHSRGRFAETFARHTPEPPRGTVPVTRMWTVMAGAATLALAMFVAGSVVSGGITLTSGVSATGQAPDPGRNAAAVGAPGQAGPASQNQSDPRGAPASVRPTFGTAAPSAGTTTGPWAEQPLIALPSATPSPDGRSIGLGPMNTINVQPPVVRTVTATPSTAATTATATATATAPAAATTKATPAAKAAARSTSPALKVGPATPTAAVTSPVPTATVTVTSTPTPSATSVTTVTTTVTPTPRPTTERDSDGSRERSGQGNGAEPQAKPSSEKQTDEQGKPSGEQGKSTGEQEKPSGDQEKKPEGQNTGNDSGRPFVKSVHGVRLVSLASNQCVDAGRGTDGTPLTLQPCSGAASQRWVFHQDGTIRSSSGLCMDVAMANTADGTTIQVANCNNGPAQRFAIQDGRLQYPAASKCVDARANAASLQLWGCADSATQKWRKA